MLCAFVAPPPPPQQLQGTPVARRSPGPALPVPRRRHRDVVGGVLVHNAAQRGPELHGIQRQAYPFRGGAFVCQEHPGILRIHWRGGVSLTTQYCSVLGSVDTFPQMFAVQCLPRRARVAG